MKESILYKLSQNKISLLGAVFIAVMSLLAVFAYLLIDDPSPGANEQNAEIALRSPGFKTDYLYLKSNETSSSKSGLEAMFFGLNRAYKVYPVQSAELTDEGVAVLTYYDQKNVVSYSSLHKNDIGNKTYWLGTDRYGRSIMSRLVLGVRVSLMVGLLAVLISLSIGVALGAVAGYFGGWLDRAIMYLINVMWSIPTLLLVFAIVLAFGRGLGIIFLAVGLTMWVDVARIVRGQVMQVKAKQYVMAARSIGQTDKLILYKHILPNIVGPILVMGAANFATAILIEAGLSYLGFGVKPPTPSIGNMLNEHYGYAVAGRPVLALVPAVTIMLLVLAFNVVGSGLRDVFDVKSTT